MSIVESFRLTKLLHDQVEGSGDRVDKVLRSWKVKDYRNLCEYVTQCKGVVPKYVARLAKVMDVSTGDVVMEIVGAQPSTGGKTTGSGRDTSDGNGYLPEDTVDRSALVQSIVNGRESEASL